ncbi:MAG: tyrosine-protein phosphatase [Pseudomonadota bacterium]
MTMRPLLLLASALLLHCCLPAASAAEAAEAVRPTDWAAPVEKAANLYRITPTFFRSARLKPADVERAKALGIRTVVSLRAFHSDTELLKGSGLRTVQVRINTWDIRDAQVVAALRAVRSAEKDGPVLLHCLHGADRTGLISAMYRMAYQGWTKQQALHELRNGGYGYHAIWTNIERYVKRVDVEKIRARAEQAART